MSMLSERRRRQKQGPNPCGKWWSEDSNKFGQRMLEKMGWSKGKGLGINEQGITQHISISQKKDTTGLGFDENAEINIYEKNYNEILQKLNERMNGTKNLENTCNSSNIDLVNLTKQRSSYQKATKCKDINKYKPKDLANIFGQKEWVREDQSEVKKEDTICTEKTIEIKNTNNGVITINGGSMVDYFKHKSIRNTIGNTMNSVTSKSNKSEINSICTPDNLDDNAESENEQQVGFGFSMNKDNATKENVSPFNCKVSNNFDEKNNYAFDNPCLNLNSPDTSEINYSVIKQSSKKRKKKCENDSLHIEGEKCKAKKKLKTGSKDGFVNLGLDLDVKSEESCNSKEFEVSTVQLGLENHGLDLTDETCAKKRVTFNNRISIVEFCVNPTKSLRCVSENIKTKGVDPCELKKKKRWTWVSATTIPLSGDSSDNELSLSYIVEEKKKRKKASNLEAIQESAEQEKEVSEVKTKMKVDNLNTNVTEIKETNIEDKNSKKKKKQETVIGNITATVITKKNENEREKQIQEVESSVKHKKKKKKKKDKNICKTETEMSNNQEDTKILDQIKQQQNVCLIENVDATKVEALSIEEKEPSASTKPKKEKRKIVTENEEIANSAHEKAISDKKNIEEEIPNKLAKKKKTKETKNEEVTDTTTINKQEKIENTEFIYSDASLSWSKDTITDNTDSPCRIKTEERMSKKLLMALYHSKAISNFPGSNIYAIKGYGVDIDF